MKTSALKKKSIKDLQKHATDLRRQILEARKKQALAEATDTTEVGKLRKELSRTLTFMTEKMEEQNG